jgi:hypothetical protein
MFSFEAQGFFSLEVLHKLQFSCKILQFSAIKTLDPDTELDPELY